MLQQLTPDDFNDLMHKVKFNLNDFPPIIWNLIMNKETQSERIVKIMSYYGRAGWIELSTMIFMCIHDNLFHYESNAYSPLIVPKTSAQWYAYLIHLTPGMLEGLVRNAMLKIGYGKCIIWEKMIVIRSFKHKIYKILEYHDAAGWNRLSSELITEYQNSDVQLALQKSNNQISQFNDIVKYRHSQTKICLSNIIDKLNYLSDDTFEYLWHGVMLSIIHASCTDSDYKNINVEWIKNQKIRSDKMSKIMNHQQMKCWNKFRDMLEHYYNKYVV